MSFQSVKGTRDFYPEDMAIRNWFFDKWRAVSLRNGFAEYDGPIFEYLDLYTTKSGDEIVEQLFSLTDRGGRQLALRPEMTPTLARMINARIATLPRPIKWFSMPRLNRAERQQRGRLREFFQWNIDIVGSDELIADAEAIFVAIDFFREVGLTPETVVMKVSSRRMVGRLLCDLGFAEADLSALYALLDRKNKLPPAAYAEQLARAVPDADRRKRLDELFACGSLAEVGKSADWSAAAREAIGEVSELFGLLGTLGVADYCAFDIGVIRGLAYYTGPVFEAYGKGGLKRAICGGGRYDDLLKGLGGEAVGAVGFGSSDVVVQDVLEEFRLLPGLQTAGPIHFFVIDADPALFGRVLSTVGALRGKGFGAEFSYRRQAVGKQLRAASARQARVAVILGQETTHGEQVTVKRLAGGEQSQVALASLLADPAAVLNRAP